MNELKIFSETDSDAIRERAATKVADDLRGRIGSEYVKRMHLREGTQAGGDVVAVLGEVFFSMSSHLLVAALVEVVREAWQRFKTPFVIHLPSGDRLEFHGDTSKFSEQLEKLLNVNPNEKLGERQSSGE